jgi:hypothetical protein
MAVERPKPRPHPVHVEEAVDLPKQVVSGNVALWKNSTTRPTS